MSNMFDMIPKGPQTEYAQAMPDKYRKWAMPQKHIVTITGMRSVSLLKWERGQPAAQWWVDREDKELNIYGRCVA